MKINSNPARSGKCGSFRFTVFCGAVAISLALVPLVAAEAKQRSFRTPEQAAESLKTAVAAGDVEKLVELVGDDYRGLVVTGEPDVDADIYADTARKMDVLMVLDPVSADKRVLLIGPDAWPFPIPLVHGKSGWRLDSEQGREELLNRRIGRNELEGLKVMDAFVAAQREYASVDQNGDGVLEYAGRLGSSLGEHDGLYWPVDAENGEQLSPFGPLVAESSIDPGSRTAGDPYQGYHYNILTGQGEHAAGGAFGYTINGRLLSGVGLIAYPAEYGVTGIMSFMVNMNGKIFEADLGNDSAAIAAAITEFDPGPGWSPVDEEDD